MRFRELIWLALVPLLAVSPAGGGESRADTRILPASIGEHRPDARNEARPAALVTVQVIARSGAHHDVTGTGTSGAQPESVALFAGAVCPAQRTDPWPAACAAAAQGRLLPYFPTAPPLQG